MSSASFARLLDGGEQSVIGVCFRNKQCFERDRPLLYVPAGGGGTRAKRWFLGV